MIYSKSLSELTIKFRYPSNWKYLFEENETDLFYNEMLGSFRFTSVKIENPDFQINIFLKNEYNNKLYLNPEWLSIGTFKFVHYKEIAKKEKNTLIHYFISGKDDILLIFSYSYNSLQDNTSEINNELQEVKKTLASIKLIKQV